MTVMWTALSFVVAIVIAALGELVSEELRARMDRIPFAMLRVAARRLPPTQRTELYDEAWVPELHHILRGDEAMPITRLIHGMRYAVRIWLSATRIGRELSPEPANKISFSDVINRVIDLDDARLISLVSFPFVGSLAGTFFHDESWSAALTVAGLVAFVCLTRYTIRRWICSDRDTCPLRQQGFRKGKVGKATRVLFCTLSPICGALHILAPVIGTRNHFDVMIAGAANETGWLLTIVALMLIDFRKRRMHVSSE